MKANVKIFNSKFLVHFCQCAIVVFAAFVMAGADAATTRGTNSRVSVTRAPASVQRVPTVTTTTATTTVAEPVSEPEPEPVIIENKSDKFGATLSETAINSTSANNNSTLASEIQRQRAALDAQSELSAATATAAANAAMGRNECDAGLRACMQEKCGKDFTDCRGDGDTVFGGKLDACRRGLNCTGEEYNLFVKEIKADRDLNAQLMSYNKILDCGNQYNDCIATQCGVDYSKCLGKAAGDAAISACSKIAKNCTQQDSGLASRAMNVFATLRQETEKQIKKDEQRLYDLRDQMENLCKSMGAMFDTRSLDCVYTVEFYAGENPNTPYASKKAYAGDVFSCNQEWFGVDITTFKENAYRLTREQESATSGLMGGGLGIAAGAISSGMINRAIDTQKAKNALKKAEKESDTDKKSDKKADKADKKSDKKSDENYSDENLVDDGTENTSENNGSVSQNQDENQQVTQTENDGTLDTDDNGQADDDGNATVDNGGDTTGGGAAGSGGEAK